MSHIWHTAWQADDIVVYRDGVAVEHLPGAEIERVVFVYRDGGHNPGDLAFTLIELAHDAVILGPETGIAGRVHFERQTFWAARDCVYWVSERSAALPRGFRLMSWWLGRSTPMAVRRVPRGELAAHVKRWAVEGPQNWQQRKWQRIVEARPAVAAPQRGPVVSPLPALRPRT